MVYSQKRVIGIVIAVFVILLAGWLVWKRAAKHESPTPADPASTTLELDKDAAKDLSQSQALEGKIMEGTLKSSNNPKRGNLMLVTATSTIYIYTSRDYSALLDKQVQVSYDGTPDDFRLGDIVAK